MQYIFLSTVGLVVRRQKSRQSTSRRSLNNIHQAEVSVRSCFSSLQIAYKFSRTYNWIPHAFLAGVLCFFCALYILRCSLNVFTECRSAPVPDMSLHMVSPLDPKFCRKWILWCPLFRQQRKAFLPGAAAHFPEA